MDTSTTPDNPRLMLTHADLARLIALLRENNYRVVGPTVTDGAIVYDTIESIDDLPRGWTDEQEAGSYSIKHTHHGKLFDYTVGPQSWKKFLFPSRQKIFSAQRNGKGFDIADHTIDAKQRYAFIGVRACELEAMRIQDRVFTSNGFVDASYQWKREQAFVIAVNCTRAGNTCFCASMNTGPKAQKDFDLSLTEMVMDSESYFTMEVGSERAAELMREFDMHIASDEDIEQANHQVEQCIMQMGRSLDTANIHDLLVGNLDHPHWDNIATRCMTCANCTLVCPTCFCSTVEDVTDLTGDHAERWKRWDSCFTMDFAKVVGGNFRPSSKARYRQWLTHKFAHWIDQFGTSGCVGCGRCITWCPVGIDVTKEIESIRSSSKSEIPQS